MSCKTPPLVYVAVGALACVGVQTVGSKKCAREFNQFFEVLNRIHQKSGKAESTKFKCEPSTP